MSQAIDYNVIKFDLPKIRERLRFIKLARAYREWALADAVRDELLALDNGFKISVDRDGRVTLWHWPNPPFTNQFHSANYGEFIANSEGL